MKVALSILTVDYLNVESSLKDYIDDVDYIHMDVMDGEFVPNISFGYSFIKALKKGLSKPFDTHLMIMHPQNYIEKFADAGSEYITFHYEADCNIKEVIDQIHACGCKAGISIKPNTPVEAIKEYLKDLEMVLVMSVEPGFGGQKFMPSAIDKVRMLKSLKEENSYNYLINIDGGINNQTAPMISEYVDLAVSGSYVVNAENPKANLEILKNI